MLTRSRILLDIIILVLLCITHLQLSFVNADPVLIEDFTQSTHNKFGGLRSGSCVDIVKFFTQESISIHSKDQYLTETIALPGQTRNLNGKSLKIEYTSQSAGARTLKLLTLGPNNRDIEFTSLSEDFKVGRNYITVPFSRFRPADLARGHGFSIGGPLEVYRIWLADSAQPSNRAYAGVTSHEPVPKKSPHPLYGHDLPRNLNSLGLYRNGEGITKLADGINIKQDGFLIEALVSESRRMDLTRKIFRITYSAKVQSSLSLQLQYSSSAAIGSRSAVMVTNIIRPGPEETTDFPVSRFHGVRPMDVTFLKVKGPAKIRLIMLVTPHSRSGEFVNDLDHFEEIDDLSTWHSKAATLSKKSYPDDRSSWRLPGNRTPPLLKAPLPGQGSPIVTAPVSDRNRLPRFEKVNKLRHICYGEGVSVVAGGIKLSMRGHIIEPLAEFPRTFDITGAFIEIKYSADRRVTRPLHIVRIFTNPGGKSVLTEEIKVNFNEARNSFQPIPVPDGGPALSIRILGGKGELTIHGIQLREPIRGRPGQYRVFVLDDFSKLTPDNSIVSDPNQSVWKPRDSALVGSAGEDRFPSMSFVTPMNMVMGR